MTYRVLTPQSSATPPTGTEQTIIASRVLNGGQANEIVFIHPTTGANLIGQLARASSIPVTLSTEDITALSTITANLGTIGDVATQTTLASVLAAIQATLNVSASSLPLPTGAAAETTLQSILAALASVSVTGPLTDAQLRAAVVPVSLQASETVLGRVDGTPRTIEPTITVDTAAYTAGDVIGGKLNLTGALRTAGQPTLLYEIHLTDAENQRPTGQILIFDTDPTAATTTDNAAFAYSTDLANQIAAIPITSGDWVTVAGDAFATVQPSRLVTAASGTTLYAVFVTTSTPDYVASTDLRIVFKFL